MGRRSVKSSRLTLNLRRSYLNRNRPVISNISQVTQVILVPVNNVIGIPKHIHPVLFILMIKLLMFHMLHLAERRRLLGFELSIKDAQICTLHISCIRTGGLPCETRRRPQLHWTDRGGNHALFNLKGQPRTRLRRPERQ